MSTVAHFINVGQGNMTLLILSDGTVVLCDCNVTDANADRVLGYLKNFLPVSKIDIFVNSHRDADHMRGLKRIDALFPIKKVWDSDVTGTTPDSSEYREYMGIRRRGFEVVRRKTRFDFGSTRLRVMNAQNDDLRNDPNAQSIVIKVEHRPDEGLKGSLMLTGDSDACTWREAIVPAYAESDLKSSIMLASHHGALSFFDDPGDVKNYYTQHIRHINPAMVIISVGPNVHGHPDPKALEFYEKYATGSGSGNKVWRTDQQGSMRLTLKDDGGWALSRNL